MIRHKTLWLMAAFCVLVASGIALARFVMDEREARATNEVRALRMDALSALDVDPGVAQVESRRLLRKAAVAAVEGQLGGAEAYYLLGQQYVREVDYHAAEAQYRRAIALAPEWSRPHAALGRLLLRNAVGRREEAEKELQRAISIEPGLWDPHDSLGILYRVAGRLEEAYVAASRAVELAPDLVGPHNNLANLLMAMKRYEEAEEQYRAAIALDQEHAKPYYNLACLYSITGRREEALEHLEAAIRRAPVLRLEAASDDDFKTLRRSARFQELIAQPEEKEEEEMDEGAEETAPE